MPDDSGTVTRPGSDPPREPRSRGGSDLPIFLVLATPDVSVTMLHTVFARSRVLATVAVAVAVGLAGLSPPALSDDGASSGDLSTYKAALVKLKEQYAQVRAEAVETDRYGEKGDKQLKTGQTRAVGYAISEGRTKFSSRTLTDPRVPQEVFGDWIDITTPDQTFSVTRDKERGPFALQSLGPRDFSAFHFNLQLVRGVFHAPLAMDTFFLPDLVNDPNTHFDRIEHGTANGRDSVTFHFRPETGKGKPYYKGWFRVAPANHWSGEAYEWGLPSGEGPKMGGSVTYGEVVDGWAAPDEVVLREVAQNGHISERLFKFTKFDRGPTPAEEFTLDYYGLADAARPARPRVPLVYWLIALALVALALSVALRLYGQRRAARESA